MKLLVAGTIACAAFFAGPAEGAALPAHPKVRLQLSPCLASAPAEVRRIVAVELGVLLDDSPELSADTTGVEVTCRGKLTVLHVDDPLTGKSLGRSINLETVAANSLSRLLALAVAELVAASWTELETNPHPVVAPVESHASPEVKKAAVAVVRERVPVDLSPARRPPVWELAALGSTQIFFAGSGALWGGGLELTHALGRYLALRVDGLGHHGSAAVSLGAVDADTVSGSAALLVRHDWPRLRIDLGAGLRGGAAHLQGIPADLRVTAGDTVWGGWLGPMASAGLRVSLARAVVAVLLVEGGYVAVPVGGLVNGVRQVAIDGSWVGVSLGLGLASRR